ncbi:ABC transporter ATP-binding protein [Plantibacter sp. Mn2098]|uniref:ABC transporter ATP-binding protein n=1 Tax=Plantibacter sp. Mn2098 TaxID=3395266 RepID=UPI003BC43121
MTHPENPAAATPASGVAGTVAVALSGITKRFGAVVANDGIDLVVPTGTVHAVMGENGAGKSTLMSILFGLTQPDAGQITVEGAPVRFAGAADAIRVGLGMVHQHFRLVDEFTVAENVVFGAEPRRFGLIDRRAAARRVRELADRFGLEIDPEARVDTLSAGVRQRVEILKALHRDARILILDEPTAVLTPNEVTALFTVIRRAVDEGTTVLLVTHKIQEVLAISDAVTVLRGGRVTGRFRTADTNATELVHAMTGREVLEVRNTGTAELGDIVLQVEGLVVGDGRTDRVRDVSLEVRGGEILGIAGVSGNGQHELVAAILGTQRVSSGRISLLGEDVTTLPVFRRRGIGLAVIPEDRRGEGLAVTMTIAENLSLGHHRTPPLGADSGLRRGWLSPRAVKAWSKELAAAYDVRTPSTAVPAGSLSGGNAQKVVLARELTHNAPLLIAEQPTQGVDVGAIEAIHERLLTYRSKEHAVLLVSHEISELQALADRIAVMLDGRIVAVLDRDEATNERLGAAMSGVAL